MNPEHTDPKNDQSAQVSAPSTTPLSENTAHVQPDEATIASEAAANASGKGYAITGLVLAFIPFLQLIGLMFSIIGKVKAHSGTSANTISIVGIVLNAILLSIGALIIVVSLSYMVESYSAEEPSMSITERAEAIRQEAERKSDALRQTNTATSLSTALSMEKNVLAAQSALGRLPNSIAELEQASRYTIEFSIVEITSAPKDPHATDYAICDNGKTARFGWWNYNKNVVEYNYVQAGSEVTSATNCKIVL